ncbi:hypothetical protein [Nocardia pseudovaccinii]|uniref:hypothetical protein n=1 Tax=Nocardia pseudovaccinii TaxID=189540 RepID=UPI0007A42197|nr:hypothetical protein [Nocardia pseudovaccinii]
MGSGDQIGMDFGEFDLTQVKTQTPPGPPEWVRWFRQMDAQLEKFATETVPGLPEPIWSDAAIDRVAAVFGEFFPYEDSVTDPEKADIADQFVRWIGECYVHRRGMQWYNHPHASGGRYQGFGPAVREPGNDAETTFVVEILEWAAHDDLTYVRHVLG